MVADDPARPKVTPFERRARIAELNDRFRRDLTGGQVMITPGVLALIGTDPGALLRAVATFSSFDTGNDPYGEHDFGALDWQGERVFWKVDYYDPTLTMGSDDPADPAVTARVLTIILACEY